MANIFPWHKAAPALQGLQHINLPAMDLERAVRFYRDVLGLTVQWREEGMVMLGNGDAAIALMEGYPAMPKHFHFGWKIAGREAVLAWRKRLEEAGVSIVHEREEENGDIGIYFSDTEGNKMEIYCEAKRDIK